MLRNESLKIYIDRLKDGHKEKIHESVNSELICSDVPELKFVGLIEIRGEVYLTEGQLICCLDIHAKVLLPCTVCNHDVQVNVDCIKVYQVIEVSTIKGAVFDLRDLVREMILLEIPAFVECGGTCPTRKELSKYLKQDEKVKENRSPFDKLSSETFL